MWPGHGNFLKAESKDLRAPEKRFLANCKEELSLISANYQVVESKGTYRYVFPPGRTKEGYHGQEQIYFLIEFIGVDSDIDIATEEPEFVQVRWIKPSEFQINWVPGFKQNVYRQFSSISSELFSHRPAKFPFCFGRCNFLLTLPGIPASPKAYVDFGNVFVSRFCVVGCVWWACKKDDVESLSMSFLLN